MKYTYKAIDTEGKITEGTAEAVSKLELGKELRKEGLNLILANEESNSKAAKTITAIKNFGTVSKHDIILFAKNLSSMLTAGLSLARAIEVINRQSKNRKFKKILNAISEDVKKGVSFSDALKKYPKVFSQLFSSMVAAGEESGNLANSLKIVGEQMEKNYLLKKKVKGAMIYPSVIIVAMILIAIFMLLFIVPTLTETFNTLEVELPATTRFVIFVSDFVKNNILLFLIFIIVFLGSFFYGLKTKTGKRSFEWVLLHLPVVSLITKETNSARTARTLSALLSSGVSYVKSVEITKEVVQNSYYKDILKEVEEQVQVGKPVSSVFAKAEKFYPVFVSEMVAVGEETGELSDMLLKTAIYYEEEVEQKTKNLSTIVEPVLMIFVGIAVGFFAISMISPMYSLVENI